MKLSAWAKKNGLCYKTAWKLAIKGQIPNCRRLPTGTILIDEDIKKEDKAVIYARVSSNDQKADLGRQIERLKSFCLSSNLNVVSVEHEIASGLNGCRKKLIKILQNNSITTIVVEHRDRLSRFGVDYIEALLVSSGRRLVVVDESEYKYDLVQDFVDIATSMCAKIYGRRSAKNRAAKALKAINED